MCFVWSKRPLRFLHDLPKAQQLQQARLSLGAVLSSSPAIADHLFMAGHLAMSCLILLAWCPRGECELAHSSQTKRSPEGGLCNVFGF